MENNSENESVGASPVDEIDGGSSSENVPEEIAGIQNLTLDEVTEDLISTLPDPLIQHILSFLPSTKEAIQTGILSKRWQNQWSRAPVLIFNSTGMSTKNFFQSIDNTLMLHDCSKINKLHIQYDHKLDCDPQLTSKIRSAIRKNVEELILHHCSETPYVLPKFLFSNASLVKLELFKCYIVHNRCPDWPNLKELKLECYALSPSAITNVVSGSLSLECLELTSCIEVDNVVIASKSLKKLIFVDVESSYTERMEISCPNLEQLSVKISECSMIPWSDLPGETIENVLSSSFLLHKLELPDCGCSERFVIASKSLKKFVLGEIYGTRDFEISCPDLEEVDLYRFVPWDLSYIIDVESGSRLERTLAMKILGQLQHMKLLEIGSWFIKILSDFEVEGLSSPLLNCKCLTLNGNNFDEHLPGIICAIRGSPLLEKLVIKLQPNQHCVDMA